MKINELKTPCYVIDEGKLIKNLEILKNVIFLLLIMLYILTFIATLSKMDINDSMYKFYWQM